MDEVPGRTLQAVASALDVTYCQSCSNEDEKTLEAYCTICKEFMCSACTKAHQRVRITKSHTLLDKSSMPTTIRGFETKEESTNLCDIHPGEIIKYFCLTHQTLNCGHCLALDLEHRSCNVSLISDISKAFIESQQYGNINEAIAQLLKHIDDFHSDVRDSYKQIENLRKSEITKLRKYRDQVNKYFDEREKELLHDINQMTKMDEALLDSLRPKCDNLKTKVKEIKIKLEAKENNCRLFIDAQKAKKMLEGFQSTLAEINKAKTIHQYQFWKDPVTEKMLASKTGLGTVKETVGTNTLEQQPFVTADLTSLMFTPGPGIPVKSPSDTYDCFLSSMLLLPFDRLLLADWNNQAIRLVDLETNTLVSQVSVPGQPRDMCLLPQDKVAVTLTTGSVQFLETWEQLSHGNRIKVDGDCQGIGYHNDCLIVSNRTGKVEIMNMEGKVLKKLSNSWFEHPYNLTVVGEGQTAVIYLADSGKHTIFKLDMDLNILQIFQDPTLRAPRSISVVGNQLLICSWKTNNIMCLDLPSGQMTQLFIKKMGEIKGPHNICFSQQKKEMYVTCDSYCSAVGVFKTEINI